jgi:hypothetical protein
MAEGVVESLKQADRVLPLNCGLTQDHGIARLNQLIGLQQITAALNPKQQGG